jgi:glutathione-regulated potassium-efflux system ancillary protein KefF
MVLVLQAHPYPDRSRANRALAAAIDGLDGVEVRSLYDLYPDYAIDVDVEQEALLRAHTIVWQCPLYWYSAPALLKLWFEKVLAHGWAYGDGGTHLQGKQCLWVVTTGADAQGYAETGSHRYPFEAFIPVMQQTAQFCGMQWLPPIIVHGAHKITKHELDESCTQYRVRIETLVDEEVSRSA